MTGLTSSFPSHALTKRHFPPQGSKRRPASRVFHRQHPSTQPVDTQKRYGPSSSLLILCPFPSSCAHSDCPLPYLHSSTNLAQPRPTSKEDLVFPLSPRSAFLKCPAVSTPLCPSEVNARESLSCLSPSGSEVRSGQDSTVKASSSEIRPVDKTGEQTSDQLCHRHSSQI